MRQYSRDFDALERWTRSHAHKEWWGRFARDAGGTGFWHGTYFLRGGIEAIYIDAPAPLGLISFAPVKPAKGSMFSARRRARLEGENSLPSSQKQSSRDRPRCFQRGQSGRKARICSRKGATTRARNDGPTRHQSHRVSHERPYPADVLSGARRGK